GGGQRSGQGITPPCVRREAGGGGPFRGPRAPAIRDGAGRPRGGVGRKGTGPERGDRHGRTARRAVVRPSGGRRIPATGGRGQGQLTVGGESAKMRRGV